MTLRKQQAERAEMRRTLVGSGDRSERIRTYNFPQNRCTDHRIGENFNLEPIIAGDLRKLIKALQDFDREQRLAAMVQKI
jgi:peptide chain release factor 1